LKSLLKPVSGKWKEQTRFPAQLALRLRRYLKNVLAIPQALDLLLARDASRAFRVAPAVAGISSPRIISKWALSHKHSPFPE